ncbi:mediator of RNA polymerase II transcription subunit 8 [Phialemonium atrogriseum]|uniref:Mediator of RNA polymerase II transcription subunit 8 n=1 Tax=Phialemonium atrogriseum TaxID=1093897 RepID=A0AAJ0BZH8_9PEZI|nr:mediator of RNA polymerase II transcription subunit 8 [Phialemonium atrogriseum]KAK1767116.1 mediator of RNA polymerase II transcription subunit 8 [Phialemonium atrogriseum]
MASLDLSQEELKAIESTRGRLFQLSNSIGSLKNDIYKSNPLPTPASLQASAFILQQNLASLQKVIAENTDLFQRVAVHPSTNFPGRTQEPVLLQLLRKKLEPDIETWVEQGRGAALAAGVEVSAARAGAGAGHPDDEDDDDDDDDEEEGYRPEDDDEEAGAGDPLSELWVDVRDACVARVGDYVRNEDNDVYTAEERAMGVERVRTGLRRDLEEEEESDEEEDEDEDEEMAGAGAGGGAAPAAGGQPAGPAAQEVEPEYILWFVVRGDASLPANIERESQRRVKDVGKRGSSGR